MKPIEPEISGNDIADEIEAGSGRHAMKPIEQVFLNCILESPDDDAPRLIYADWLEEDGQEERAKFIRCEVILHRWLHTPSNSPGGTAEDGGAAGRALATMQQLEERLPRAWLDAISRLEYP